MIRHFVALRFREGTGERAKAVLMADLAGLETRLDGILDFQARRNISVEDQMVRGFRDVFWFDFRDEAARDAYLADEGHRAIGTRIVAALEGGESGVFVADFEA